MSAASTIRYLAYGSNMWPRRIEQRLGKCDALGVVSLEGFALRFHKRGRDGSGKCDAFYTGDAADTLYGVVYALSQAQRELLDDFEGPGYDACELSARLPSGVITAYAYVARPEHMDAQLQPFHWYKAIVVAGARAHSLPAHYINRLLAVNSTIDPDADRETQHQALLHGDFTPRMTR